MSLPLLRGCLFFHGEENHSAKPANYDLLFFAESSYVAKGSRTCVICASQPP